MKNPRTHIPRQIKHIVASIQEFGFINPVLIDGLDGIVAGHARVEPFLQNQATHSTSPSGLRYGLAERC
ncbi:ParB N-terminal domain-containing protein [Pseudorhodoplanes sp.]|uniref:ParB N-terminal domain-containing protein n=1 Tax=Pseudorhodoplanes sp. TaxID=1934341 RepID=UPI003D114693